MDDAERILHADDDRSRAEQLCRIESLCKQHGASMVVLGIVAGLSVTAMNADVQDASPKASTF
jgi:hypothetical protein